MKYHNLTTCAKIKGFGAASGLLYQNNKLLLISDDSEVLYKYDIESKELTKHSLRKDEQLLEAVEKTKKSDFESITIYKNKIMVFGSGSAPNRNKVVELDKRSLIVTQEKDTSKFYQSIQRQTVISQENFNIEGVIANDEYLLLFNRGNGPNSINGIFKIKNWQEKSAQEISFIEVLLPKVEGVPYGFTDAIQVKHKIYFLASAESGRSTYEDGEILGSIIGILDAKTFKHQATQEITKKHKFEGIALYKQNPDEISFLLCEDPDDGGSETEIFKLTLYLKRDIQGFSSYL